MESIFITGLSATVRASSWSLQAGQKLSVELQRGFSLLARHFRLVFIDTRGSGLSGCRADPAQMGSLDMAAHLEALRAHLGLSEIGLLRPLRRWSDYSCLRGALTRLREQTGAHRQPGPWVKRGDGDPKNHPGKIQ